MKRRELGLILDANPHAGVTDSYLDKRTAGFGLEAGGDVSDLGLNQPASFFEARGIGLNDGTAFGSPGFVRFNFGCSHAQLEIGLQRLEAALAEASARA